MKTILKITTTCLIMFHALTSNAITIQGIVKDKQSGSPIIGVTVKVKNTKTTTTTNADGIYKIDVNHPAAVLIFSHVAYVQQEIAIKNKSTIEVNLVPLPSPKERSLVNEVADEEIEIKKTNVQFASAISLDNIKVLPRRKDKNLRQAKPANYVYQEPAVHNTEEYDVINENVFKTPFKEPLSTFSIDVDAASYSNVRRMLTNGQAPAKDMVRIEEMINYFNYDYPSPAEQDPFSITTEVSYAPWNNKHHLVHIGLQGRKLDYNDLQPCNLVFLIDVSGSMSAQNKLPLLRSSLTMLVNQLDSKDKVAIVVYAGSAGLVLPSTPASEKEKIIAALDRLQAGGSTAGGAGIKLAYKIAKQNLLKDGNNRVILATDGDFNVGASSSAEMVRLIEEKRKEGIFLTITGFGMGNYKDGRMEQISNAGNGNYFYIDNMKEAEKVFVKEMRATLFTIAKDVKIQVEFNPHLVQAYRLIGYENRALNAEDFNDDKKDAGELGAGHTVTAIYEIIPHGVKSSFIRRVDPLKYQLTSLQEIAAQSADELLTVKFRYKHPKGEKSMLIVQSLKNEVKTLKEASDNFRFSAAVAEFGMLLRDSEFKSDASYEDVLMLAESAFGQDANGYRAEFVKMVQSSKLIAQR